MVFIEVLFIKACIMHKTYLADSHKHSDGKSALFANLCYTLMISILASLFVGIYTYAIVRIMIKSNVVSFEKLIIIVFILLQLIQLAVILKYKEKKIILSKYYLNILLLIFYAKQQKTLLKGVLKNGAIFIFLFLSLRFLIEKGIGFPFDSIEKELIIFIVLSAFSLLITKMLAKDSFETNLVRLLVNIFILTVTVIIFIWSTNNLMIDSSLHQNENIIMFIFSSITGLYQIFKTIPKCVLKLYTTFVIENTNFLNGVWQHYEEEYKISKIEESAHDKMTNFKENFSIIKVILKTNSLKENIKLTSLLISSLIVFIVFIWIFTANQVEISDFLLNIPRKSFSYWTKLFKGDESVSSLVLIAAVGFTVLIYNVRMLVKRWNDKIDRYRHIGLILLVALYTLPVLSFVKVLRNDITVVLLIIVMILMYICNKLIKSAARTSSET